MHLPSLLLGPHDVVLGRLSEEAQALHVAVDFLRRAIVTSSLLLHQAGFLEVVGFQIVKSHFRVFPIISLIYVERLDTQKLAYL
jgi:hypothetical protein